MRVDTRAGGSWCGHIETVVDLSPEPRPPCAGGACPPRVATVDTSREGNIKRYEYVTINVAGNKARQVAAFNETINQYAAEGWMVAEMVHPFVIGPLGVQAWSEATSVDAPVREWCGEEGAGRERSVYATTAAVAAVAGQIGAQFPNWVKQGRKNGADPFVIAVAEVEGGMVISGETNGGPGRPRIPCVCGQRQIGHGRLVDLIISEDWVIG